MCGIVYVKRKDGKPAFKSVLKRYRAQKSRGTQGYGYVAVKDGKVVSYKRSPTEHEIIKLISQEDAPEILFHHRFPTSVPNIEEAAHPIMVEKPELLENRYFVVHNGVISNSEELYNEHVAAGFKYNTEIQKGFSTFMGKFFHEEADWNDSESIAIETALVIDRKKTSIGTRGSAAVIGMKTDADGKVLSRFFYRNDSNPLKFLETPEMITITSEGKGELVPSDFVKFLKLDGGYGDVKQDSGMRIATPWSYRTASYVAPVPHTHHVYGGEASRNPDDLDDDISRHTRQMLPASEDHRNIGFLDGEEVGLALTDEQDRFHFASEDEGMIDIGRVIKESKNFGAFVRTLTEDTLWSEYDKSIAAKEEIEMSIALLNQDVEAMDSIDAEVMGRRTKLQDQLDAVSKYEKELEDEITRRESLANTTQMVF